MEKVIMNTERTDTGYCCSCELLPGWVVAYGEDFNGFKNHVKASIDFYIDCRKEDNEPYPSIFDDDYDITYNFITY